MARVARLYDAGVGSDGLPYLAMEYVAGQPITAWSDAHQLGVRERLKLTLQVLDAVEYAHVREVLHWDIKPSNDAAMLGRLSDVERSSELRRAALPRGAAFGNMGKRTTRGRAESPGSGQPKTPLRSLHSSRSSTQQLLDLLLADSHVSFVLRSPTSSDYNAIASWVTDAEECARWAGPHIPFPFSGDDLPALIRNVPPIVPGETSESFILFEEDLGNSETPALAFGQIVREDEANSRLARIIVAPTSRGAGIGTAFCRLLISKAFAARGLKFLKLFVHRENEAALRLYASLGFIVAPPHPRPDVIAMKRTA